MLRRVGMAGFIGLVAAVLLMISGCAGSSNKDLELGGINLADVLDGLLTRTQQTLASVTDPLSAKTAADELKLISQDFDDLAYHVPMLPADGQIALTKEVSKNLSWMQEMAASVNSSPALRDILGAQMNTLVEKMKGLMAL